MAITASLHLKLDPAMDEQLGRLAARRRTSKGQLVGEAVSACYRAALTDLPLAQRHALSAYQGGYISIGRLARAMGMHVVDLRRWLDEHGLPQSTAYGDGDAANA